MSGIIHLSMRQFNKFYQHIYYVYKPITSNSRELLHDKFVSIFFFIDIQVYQSNRVLKKFLNREI